MTASWLWDFHFIRGKGLLPSFSTNAPTMTNTDETKDKFYEDFEYIISAVPTANKLIILGDFNARFGQDCASWERVLGKHGTRKCNSLLLLQTCVKHNLLITNTVFCFPTRNKTSWMHTRCKHWHLIMLLWNGEIGGMWESWGPWVVQNAGQIIA